MKPFLAFVTGLLIFSGGGMQGRLGSVLAAFIDPGALVEVSPNNQPPGTNQNTPGINGNPGIPPGTLPPGPGNSCPQGYIYSPVTGQCMSLAGI